MIIVDARAPQEAITNLAKIEEVLPFSTKGITYEAISGHPDVFICPLAHTIIVAPNIPALYLQQFTEANIPYIKGERPVGESLEETTLYNCVVTTTEIAHKAGFTDAAILKLTADKNFLPLPQAYSRCSLIKVKDLWITSDAGIAKALSSKKVCLQSPKEIILPPYPYGFLGGTMGFVHQTLYIMGNPEKYPIYQPLLQALEKHRIEWKALYDGPLVDVGGIFHFNEKPFIV
ncbi:DUF6873 family GME fold protein [Persicobacter diffluens]|uniref:DUF6873 domain-containing protein n=1 Tax=Persicobacter diffluens TaxID=981 RepID=A0AAN4W249_9BACT|nr:hypothetical protein PEDI_45050 [Persicobacter diffluens]